ncbi:MAG: NUDIX domain-containing protein [Candidatus Sumerlaeaceae bacterium]|nr:NUDIX domain-containing protein [Candidatus Sumerlaeaceae bacterium]
MAPNYTDPDELLAVVNEADVEIGSETRSRIHEQNLLHRAVHVLVFDAEGLLIIQQRSQLKDTFPLHWECVGGHLSPGEYYREAAFREVEEELGIRADNMIKLGKVAACETTGFEFIEVYKTCTAAEPKPQPDEVIAIARIHLRDLGREIANQSRPFSPAFVQTLRCVGLIGP